MPLIATGSEEGEEAGEDRVLEAGAIRLTLFTTPPQTLADALAILNWLAHPEHGLSGGVHAWIEGQESALVLLRDFMATQVGKGVASTDTLCSGESAKGVRNTHTLPAEPDEMAAPVAVDDPVVTAYLAWLSADKDDDQLAAALDRLRELGTDHPEFRTVWDRYEADVVATECAADKMWKPAQATSLAAILAKVAFFTCVTGSDIAAADIRLWQSIIADIARLGVIPLRADAALFGQGRYFGSLHREAVEEGIGPNSHHVILPTSLWEGLNGAGASLRMAAGRKLASY